MRRFLELYRETPAPELPARQFRALAGNGVVDALLRASVLESIGPARRYTCEWPELGCSRRILSNCRDDYFPWVAVCGLERPSCGDVPLRDDEAEEYRLVPERLLLQLRRVMGLTGPCDGAEPAASDSIFLGEFQRSSEAIDVFFAPARSRPALRAVLAERMLLARRAIVIAPTATGIPRDLIERYSAGNHVTLAFLSDLVAVAGENLVMVESLDKFATPRRETIVGFCVAHSNGGSRKLAAPEYEEIVRQSADFDLFIDAVLPRDHGLFAISRRHPDGRFEAGLLSRREVDALTELVERKGTPMRARELVALKDGSARSAVRVLEGARKRVDVLLSARYDWRAFPTIQGQRAGEQRYMFKAPPTLRYIVLVATRG